MHSVLFPATEPNFEYSPRTRVIFGVGSLARLGNLAREILPDGRRALVVTDSGLLKTGHPKLAVASLKSSGWEVTLYSEEHENPTTEDVALCLKVAQEARPELLVGLGGGSSLDTAKGVNFLFTNGGEMRDYWGIGKATQAMLPLIAIPTTAGTGSECQSAALIADAVTHQKMACLDAKAAARIALLDPNLTLSLPFSVTAATGIDALAHALEAAVTRKLNPISEIFARDAFTRCLPAFNRVLETPTDLAARGEMLLGAAHAGIAIENSMLGAAHAAANPLTARHGLVHGIAVGLMLPAVIRYNSHEANARRRYASLAVGAGLIGSHRPASSAIEALLEALRSTFARARLPPSLAAAGVPRDQLGQLAQEAAKQWTAAFNPRAIGVDEFRQLYETSWENS